MNARIMATPLQTGGPVLVESKRPEGPERASPTPNKARRVRALADALGVVRILALDHEASLERQLRARGPANNSDVVAFKRLILDALTTSVSGVVLDPVSFLACKASIPPAVGVLLKAEQSWMAVTSAGDRITVVNPEWTVARIAETGADGVKLMLYYHPDGTPEVLGRQRELAQEIGELCAQFELAFVLEPIGYPLPDDERGDGEAAEANRARRRPGVVVESAAEFARSRYRADLIKIDFPVDLRYVDVYSARFGNSRRPIYDLPAVRRTCRSLARSCDVPWVLMSSGASNGEFTEYVRLGVEAGASGFICGAALWSPAVERYPDKLGIEQALVGECRQNLVNIEDALSAARPPQGTSHLAGRP